MLRMMTLSVMTVPIYIICLIAALQNVESCTEFFMESEQDASTVVGRSMEFALDLQSHIRIWPKGTKRASFVPTFCSKSQSFKWQNKYDVICFDGLGLPVCSDGMNSAGLSFGALLLPGFTKYDHTMPHDCGTIISNIQLGDYILGTFNSTAQVRKAIKDNNFPKLFDRKVIGQTFELHFSVIDASGDGLVLEYTEEGRKVHKNTVHVFTNSPPYDFHMMNLNNYVHLSKFARPPKKLGNVTIQPVGAGSGMLGVPGDFTPTSRFVRTANILHFSNTPKTAGDAVNFAFHILNCVDIPKGVVQMHTAPTTGLFGYTQWIVVKDLKNRIIYVRTYDDLSIRRVDLNKIRSDKIVKLPMERKFAIEDITDTLYDKLAQEI